SITASLDASLVPGDYFAYVYGDDGGTLTSNAVANDAGYVNGDTNNLIFPTLTAALTITKATPTVTATGGTFPYDGNAHSGSGTATGAGGVSDTLSPAVTLSYDTGDGNAPVNAGTYHVTAHFAGNDNYNSKDSDPATITINPKDTTASVTASNKPYDGNTTATITTCTVDGRVGSDDVTCSAGGPNTFADKNVGTSKTVTATGITLGGGKASNYNLPTTASGAGQITAVHLTVKADDKNKTYDGSVYSPFTATISGFVNSETEAGLRASTALSGNAGFTGAATTAVNASATPYAITPTVGTLTATNYD